MTSIAGGQCFRGFYTRRRLSLALICFSAILRPAFAQSQTPGSVWLATHENERLAFILGYQQGAFYYLRVARSLQAANPATGAGKAYGLRLTPEQADAVAELILNTIHEAGVDLAPDAISGVMSEFYKDPANTLIRPPSLLLVAVMRLSGTAQPTIDRELERLRKAAAEGPR